jgi:hypothetical protein
MKRGKRNRKGRKGKKKEENGKIKRKWKVKG